MNMQPMSLESIHKTELFDRYLSNDGGLTLKNELISEP